MQAFVLVPVLLGLKGNLEMTFGARLSTLVSLGCEEEYGVESRAVRMNEGRNENDDPHLPSFSRRIMAGRE